MLQIYIFLIHYVNLQNCVNLPNKKLHLSKSLSYIISLDNSKWIRTKQFCTIYIIYITCILFCVSMNQIYCLAQLLFIWIQCLHLINVMTRVTLSLAKNYRIIIYVFEKWNIKMVEINQNVPILFWIIDRSMKILIIQSTSIITYIIYVLTGNNFY